MAPSPFSSFSARWSALGKWLLLCVLVALLSGSASAAFLHALAWATLTRESHPWLIFLLPLAGFAIGWIYLEFGAAVEAGNNLLIDQIHAPVAPVPLRMAPLILGATIISHLFGASVGREGTAVQMGGALADRLSAPFRLGSDERRMVLMAGLAGGFASVFGTPFGGAIFAIEVLALGRLRLNAALPCLLVALLADQVGLLWGVEHVHYPAPPIAPWSLWTLLAIVAAATLFGLTARTFADATHALAGTMRRFIAYSPLRPLLGGIALVLAVWALGTQRHVGLGIPVIVEAFSTPLPFSDALAKAALTVLSLGTGFKGGEVTPLFFIGATLGNALAPLLDLPFGMLAALGFVAVFAGAANTPIASTVMAIELFGLQIGPYAALACLVSYLVSGHTGIYRAQRVGRGKYWRRWPEHLRLGELAAHRKDAGRTPM